MEFVKVANQNEMMNNSMKIVNLDGKEILLVKLGGEYYALGNKCTHAGGSLGHGTLDGTCIKCPRHGARFDVQTGKAVEGAKIGFMKIKVKDETCYPVKVEGTDILVGVDAIPVKVV